MHGLQTLGVSLLLLSPWLHTSLSAAGTPASPAPGPIIPRRQRDRVLLDRAIRDGRAVTPERAIESVRQFCGDPNLEVSVERYDDTPLYSAGIGSHFRLRVSGGPWEGSFTVRAEDGSVRHWFGHGDIDYSEQRVPLISNQEAEQCARQFARERIPGFDQRVWHTPREYPVIQDATYDVIWTEVLNRSGALACWSLELTVDRASGRVISYTAPQDRFDGPLVPRISRNRALQLASRVAAYDPKRLPFQEITLEVMEDPYGVQGLGWSLMQFPDPATPDLHAQVLVDALTGQVSPPVGPLSAVSSAGERSIQPAPVSTTPQLRPLQGEPIHSFPLHRRDGALWARAELLRGLGALVSITPEHLLVRAGGIRSDEKSLGAERRSDGWWVPLRKGCTALGWETRWDAREQQVVVNNAAR